MCRAAFFLVFMAAMPACLVVQAGTSPLSKAMELLDSLTAKVTAAQDAANKYYSEYAAWCDSQSSDLKFQIKSRKAQRDKLQASITKATADIAAYDEKIESLAASISSDEQERKEAAAVRAKEAQDFAASEAELVDAISTLDRAIQIVQKEMQRNPAAFAQLDTSNVNRLIKALSSVIDAASFPASDQQKLVALAQMQRQQADDEDFGPPSASAYKTHSEGVSDVLEDLREKAEGQLSDLRKAEASTKQNYRMLEQSLSGQIDADSKDLNDEKAAKASSQEAKSIAEGDLVETMKGLDNDKSTRATSSATCTTAASDHEASVKSRNDELAALANARKLLAESASGAASRTYSFVELDHQSQTGSSLHSHADLANAEIVSLLKSIAKENHSAALAQLASRISATLRYGAANGQDPFKKVRQLITDMLTKLQGEASADATEKSYCDNELAQTAAKKDELSTEMSKLSTKLDQATTSSGQLKEEVKQLQAELAELAKSQREMDSIRQGSHREYRKAKTDLELGLAGVRKAVSILKAYYAGSAAASASMLQDGDDTSASMPVPANHAKSQEAGAEIVNELEIVESDFAKDLATEEMAEAEANAEYEKMTQTNKDTRLIKEQDVKYKTREFKALDKTTKDLLGDKANVDAELDAVLEYSSKIKQRCAAKAETYDTRRGRREAEIAGLREALAILEGESTFVQRGKKRGLRSAFLSAA